MNFSGFSRGPEAAAAAAVASTLRHEFKHVRVFRDGPDDSSAPPTLANLLFFASDAPMDFAVSRHERFDGDARAIAVLGLPGNEVTLAPGPVIYDAANPIGRLQMSIAATHFQAMANMLPREAWLPW